MTKRWQERGAGLIDYALLAACVALIAVTGVRATGRRVACKAAQSGSFLVSEATTINESGVAEWCQIQGDLVGNALRLENCCECSGTC